MFFMRGIFTALCLFVAIIACGQNQAPSNPDILLTVGGEVEHSLKLTRADFGKLRRQSVKATGHDKKESNYEGVAITEVLQQAGIKFGKDFHGKALAMYLVAEGADGYQAIFSLTEFDSSYTDRVILLAERRDNELLPANEGPLQIIVPDEKRHGRWVRQVKTLIVSKAENTRK